MSNKTVEDFETEFYAFVRTVVAHPDLLQYKTAELKRILSRLLVLENMADLETIVQGFRRNGLFTLQFYHHALAVIWEVEKNLEAWASHQNMINGLKFEPSPGGVMKSSDRQQKVVLDFVKG